MTKHELNIIKLAEFIADAEKTGNHLICKQSLAMLNGLVMAHAIITETEYIEYDQKKPEPAKDYVDL